MLLAIPGTGRHPNAVRMVGPLPAAIDQRLMVSATQLRFFGRPLRLPTRVGANEVVALWMSFNPETLHTIQKARGSRQSVPREAERATAA